MDLTQGEAAFILMVMENTQFLGKHAEMVVGIKQKLKVLADGRNEPPAPEEGG